MNGKDEAAENQETPFMELYMRRDKGLFDYLGAFVSPNGDKNKIQSNEKREEAEVLSAFVLKMYLDGFVEKELLLKVIQREEGFKDNQNKIIF